MWTRVSFLAGRFCARAKGCSYFPFSGSTLRTLAADVAGYPQTKSSLHFTPEAPLPAEMARAIELLRRQ